MARVIWHVDANAYYASIECLYNPKIRNLPVAVCGDPESRHGIVLTKNQLAKVKGVQTGEAIWEAKTKCPNLIVVKPDYDLYLRFTRTMRTLFAEYSDCVEPYGLDEAWIDVSDPKLTVAGTRDLADAMRERIKRELGITVSIGVSFNKVFAKLGSDLRKPDATSVITEDNFRQYIWPLPASALLFVGPKTSAKLKEYNIHTIGDLAHANDDLLKYKLGINGAMLKSYALGLDISPVSPDGASVPMKSVGNSTTAPHDIETMDDAKCIIYLLSESIGTRVRENGFRSNCVSISVRTTELVNFSCQRTLPLATNLTGEIALMALTLFKERYAHRMPFRSMGIHCQNLVPDTQPEQLDLWGDHAQRERMLRLDRTIDDLKGRFGPATILRGIIASDTLYRRIRPENHIKPAETYYGR